MLRFCSMNGLEVLQVDGWTLFLGPQCYQLRGEWEIPCAEDTTRKIVKTSRIGFRCSNNRSPTVIKDCGIYRTN